MDLKLPLNDSRGVYQHMACKRLIFFGLSKKFLYRKLKEVEFKNIAHHDAALYIVVGLNEIFNRRLC